MTHRRLAARASRAALLAVLTAVGCNSWEQFGTVTGRATLDGRPVTAGKVTFVTARGAVASDLGSDGTFTASNVPVGSVKIAVLPPSAFEPPVIMPSAMMSAAANRPAIPGRYTDAVRSGLSLEVHPGTQTYDIAMTADAKPRPR
jgi:hypothetical protein